MPQTGIVQQLPKKTEILVRAQVLRIGQVTLQKRFHGRGTFNQGAHVDEEHDFRAPQQIWPADDYTLTVATQTLFYEWNLPPISLSQVSALGKQRPEVARMGTVRRLAEEVGRGLKAALPTLRKTVVDKVALAVGAMIERRTPNTAELADVLPLATERQDMREHVVATVVEESVAVECGLAEALGLPSP